MRNKTVMMETAAGEQTEVLFRKLHTPEQTDCVYQKKVLKRGSICRKGGYPLPCDIVEEKNVAVVLRDGTQIFTDVYRPATEEKVPGIIAWSPYGKEFPGPPMKVKLSGLQKFEGPDPGYWVAHGYAVLNVDLRGIGCSEGEFTQWGRQQSEDGYDFVQWTAEQEWCNGKVSFAGTSYLAISQWFIAAMQPPALACIAPWEGFSNVYEHSICPGGIPDYEFEKIMFERTFHGMDYGEDMGSMAEQNSFYNAYWEDKRAKVKKIQIPAYVVASYTNKVHSRGTLESYQLLGSEKKWLRIHNTHEWYDFYTHQEDLRCFFDHYLKGINNGWEKMAPVRMSVLNPGGADIVDRKMERYPFGKQGVRKYYLDARDGGIHALAPRQASSCTYSSEKGDRGASFTLEFTQRTEIVGNICLNLCFMAEEATDADIFVMARKLDAKGNELKVLIEGAPYCKPGEKAPFEWGNGRQRVSLRNGFTHPEPIKPKELVNVDVILCPMGMIFEPGQQLKITITGYNPAVPEIPGQPEIKTVNQGRYSIITGKRQMSALYLPVLQNEQ